MDDLLLARAAIERWFHTAVERVEPRRAVVEAISLSGETLIVDDRSIPLPSSGRVVVLAIGKAAAGMAHGAADVLGDRIDTGITLAKYGHVPHPVAGFDTFEAGHPEPDANSLSATQHILTVVEGVSEADLVLALISGGGSALLELPVDGVSLGDIQHATRLLMHAGAGIHDLNTVRKALSRVKGGGLRRAIGPARCVTLLLSDVLGNDPAVIASGPTVLASPDSAAALRVIERFDVRSHLPDPVLNALREGRPPQREVDTSRDVVAVVADNAMFVEAIARSAADDGLSVTQVSEPYAGDATDLGMEMVRTVRETPESTDVIVRGGEATVTVTGRGTGGRNTEMALAAALAMPGDETWVIASLASDGDDGNSGVAGAIADGMTVVRALEAGMNPVAALVQNDSATVFRTAGGIVETGPTGTNVNDVYIALRRRALGRARASI